MPSKNGDLSFPAKPASLSIPAASYLLGSKPGLHRAKSRKGKAVRTGKIRIGRPEKDGLNRGCTKAPVRGHFPCACALCRDFSEIQVKQSTAASRNKGKRIVFLLSR
jgi:hypothetical protein